MWNSYLHPYHHSFTLVYSPFGWCSDFWVVIGHRWSLKSWSVLNLIACLYHWRLHALNPVLYGRKFLIVLNALAHPRLIVLQLLDPPNKQNIPSFCIIYWACAAGCSLCRPKYCVNNSVAFWQHCRGQHRSQLTFAY